MTRPKAYSYLRFSTPDQMDGDSFRRQWEGAKAYAERHGLDLDHELTFHDLGVPGFRGANVERGKLKAFRRAVEDEVVAPGSYLLIEDFDRLSRMDPWDAFPIFQEIINNDITIVTLKDEKVWNKDELRGTPSGSWNRCSPCGTATTRVRRSPYGSLKLMQRSESASPKGLP
jgi:DNA invertase Pin-like site-specific DNA recombinase